MEELLSNDNLNYQLSTRQLHTLLMEVSSRTDKLDSIFPIISKRFEAEGQRILNLQQANKGGRVALTEEELTTLQDWQKMVEEIGVFKGTPGKKYALFRLALNVLNFMQQLLPPPVAKDLACQLAQVMTADLKQKNIKRLIFVGHFLACLNKFPAIDRKIHSNLLEAVREHFVAEQSTEDCLEIFLNEAEHLGPEMADMLYNKVVDSFSQQKPSVLNKVMSFFTSWTGYGVDKKTMKNMSRLFSHCIGEVAVQGLAVSGFVEKITDSAIISNLMSVYPKLSKLDLLQQEIVAKAEDILDHVDQFGRELSQGKVTLATLSTLKSDPAKVERLVSLHTCFTEMRKLTEIRLKELINLRCD
jgi:hypothetical protein